MAHTPSSGDCADLPIPTHEALAHSARVVAHIERMIATSGGWISFADYMGAALYAPGLGYYVAGSRKFGPAGDFVTAPELTALFDETLAAQIEAVLVELPGSSVIELGPGTGRLAADVLSALALRDALPERYCLLEVSPDLRERQRQHLLIVLSEQSHLLHQAFHFAALIISEWPGLPALELLIEETKVVALRGESGNHPVYGKVVKHMWLRFRLQERLVLFAIRLEHAVDMCGDHRQRFNGLPVWFRLWSPWSARSGTSFLLLCHASPSQFCASVTLLS